MNIDTIFIFEFYNFKHIIPALKAEKQYCNFKIIKKKNNVIKVIDLKPNVIGNL